MQIKEGFMMRKVADHCVVVPVGNEVVDFNGMINLNEPGALLFELLQKGCSREDLIQTLLDTYEVTREQCERDADLFLDKLKKAGLLK